MRDVRSRGATLFCCTKEVQPQEINGFYRASLLKVFSSQFRRARHVKKQHRFAAATGSLKLFLNAVFINTFSIIKETNLLEISKFN
jgi:hypothetical protein